MDADYSRLAAVARWQLSGCRDRDGAWFDGLIHDFAELSARLEAQTHRRYIKTHTPADGIPIFDTASYIVVARDGRDAFVSFGNHMKHMGADLREHLNAQP